VATAADRAAERNSGARGEISIFVKNIPKKRSSISGCGPTKGIYFLRYLKKIHKKVFTKIWGPLKSGARGKTPLSPSLSSGLGITIRLNGQVLGWIQTKSIRNIRSFRKLDLTLSELLNEIMKLHRLIFQFLLILSNEVI